MLTSISPVGERARHQRWWLTATAHLAGSTLGGAGVGALLGGLGWAVTAGGAVAGRWLLWALAAAALAGAAWDLSPWAHRLPSWRRQVDERWLDAYRGWVYGAGYGLQLGAGGLTVVPATATYLAGLAAVLSAHPTGGALVGATFGLLRAVPLVASAPVRTPQRLTALMRRMDAAQPTVHRLVAGAQAAVGLAAVVLAVGG